MITSVEDTEDIIQDTWLKANDKLDTFKGESSLKTWIFSIASNLTIDHLRKQKRWPENVTDICKEAATKNPIIIISPGVKALNNYNLITYDKL